MLPFTYLSVPISNDKPRKCHLLHIVDRIKTKLASWKGKLLSFMGKLQLVQSIIHGMLIHSFMVYLWPMSLLKKLDAAIKNFVYMGNIDSKKLVTVSWKTICQPFAIGGLGICSMKRINQAAMLKLCWFYKLQGLMGLYCKAQIFKGKWCFCYIVAILDLDGYS